mmetsp:Transcript_83564/g.240110  ORF Transcript_83564/g.240110 Transcript_83564/m.240110 type:complete len:258 (-) Transcript_83564:280-1053(-)
MADAHASLGAPRSGLRPLLPLEGEAGSAEGGIESIGHRPPGSCAPRTSAKTRLKSQTGSKAAGHFAPLADNSALARGCRHTAPQSDSTGHELCNNWSNGGGWDGAERSQSKACVSNLCKCQPDSPGFSSSWTPAFANNNKAMTKWADAMVKGVRGSAKSRAAQVDHAADEAKTNCAPSETGANVAQRSPAESVAMPAGRPNRAVSAMVSRGGRRCSSSAKNSKSWRMGQGVEATSDQCSIKNQNCSNTRFLASSATI